MRDDTHTTFSAWTSFVDVTMMAILILILINLFQYLLNQDVFEMEKIKSRKDMIWENIKEAFPEETEEGRSITKDDSSPQTLTLRFSDKILFDIGRYELTESGINIIYQLADILKDHSEFFREIKVQGHTDDLQFRDPSGYNNWDLSSDRAKTVVKAILSNLPEEEKKLLENLLVAAGYSQFHPVAESTMTISDILINSHEYTPSLGNPLNRRIDIELDFSFGEEL